MLAKESSVGPCPCHHRRPRTYRLQIELVGRRGAIDINPTIAPPFDFEDGAERILWHPLFRMVGPSLRIAAIAVPEPDRCLGRRVGPPDVEAQVRLCCQLNVLRYLAQVI